MHHNQLSTYGLSGYSKLFRHLKLSHSAASVSGDTLDVYIESQVAGSNWVDVAHFTQVLGDGGPKRFIAKVTRALGQSEFETSVALGAAAVRHVFGLVMRSRWVIVGTGSFTFSVSSDIS